MSSRDVLFFELPPGTFAMFSDIGDGELSKRKRKTAFGKALRFLEALDFIPKGVKIVGVGRGCDTLGVRGVFVILDKTTVQGQKTPLANCKNYRRWPDGKNDMCANCGSSWTSHSLPQDSTENT